MIQGLVLISCILVTAAFVPLTRPASSNLVMKFSFGKKPAAAPAPAPAPAPAKKAGLFSIGAKKAPTPAPAPAPAPVKKAGLFSFGAKKAATPAPAPVKKVVPVPVKKAAPAPAPVKKAAPVPVKKAAPVPVKKAAPVKAEPAPSKLAGSGFAYGLVGSDVEAPEFDPLQLSVGRSPETIAWYRAAELKHARVAMLAALGLFVQPLIHLPDPIFDSTLGYGALTKIYSERPEAVWQILTALAAIETATLFKNGQGEAGDLGWDPLNLKKTLKLDDPAKLALVQLRELKNGRLAMLGASGLLLQEVVSGTGPYGQF